MASPAMGADGGGESSHWKWAFRALEQRNHELMAENEELRARLARYEQQLAAVDYAPAHADDGLGPQPTTLLRSSASEASLYPRRTRASAHSGGDADDGVTYGGGLPRLPPGRLPHRVSGAPSGAAVGNRSAARGGGYGYSGAGGGYAAAAGGGGGGYVGGYSAAGGGYSGGGSYATRASQQRLLHGTISDPHRGGGGGVKRSSSRATGAHSSSSSPDRSVGPSPSKRELAMAYSKKVPKPTVTVRWQSPEGSKQAGHASGGGGEGAQSSALLDETKLDYDSFVSKAEELESDRTWSDTDLRKRFDDLSPENGTIYLQDYRLTLLFEAMSKSQAKVIDLFRSMDTDNSATIDKHEFTKALREGLGFDYSDEDIDCVFAHLDGDGSGLVDYVELNAKLRPKTCRTQVHKLRTGMQLKRGGARQLALRGRKKIDGGYGAEGVAAQLQSILKKNFLKIFDVFKQWDEDESGEVDRNEFAQCVAALGYDAPRADVDECFDFFDSDKSGQISYDELYRKLRAGSKLKKKPKRVAPIPPPPPPPDEDEGGDAEATAVADAGAPPPPPAAVDVSEGDGGTAADDTHASGPPPQMMLAASDERADGGQHLAGQNRWRGLRGAAHLGASLQGAASRAVPPAAEDGGTDEAQVVVEAESNVAED